MKLLMKERTTFVSNDNISFPAAETASYREMNISNVTLKRNISNADDDDDLTVQPFSLRSTYLPETLKWWRVVVLRKRYSLHDFLEAL